MAKVWILVCDNSIAKIYVYDKTLRQLNLITELNHPEGRMRNNQLESSPRGTTEAGVIAYGNRALATDRNSKHHNMEIFAKHIMQHLADNAIEHIYDKLFIIAPPAFMGLIRSNMHKCVKPTLANEITKNLVAHNIEQIRKYLPKYLY